MARLQTESGGWAQDDSVSYPAYAAILAQTSTVSAILNTGPNYPIPGSGYEIWEFGPHVLTFQTGLAATTRLRSVRVLPEPVYQEVNGFGLTATLGYTGTGWDLIEMVTGFGLKLGYGRAFSINWGLETPGIDERWREADRGVEDEWALAERRPEGDDGWTRIRGYA